MSRQRKLESLQQLGILKAQDVAKIQTRLTMPKAPLFYNRALTGWVALALISGAGNIGLVLLLQLSWWNGVHFH